MPLTALGSDINSFGIFDILQNPLAICKRVLKFDIDYVCEMLLRSLKSEKE